MVRPPEAEPVNAASTLVANASETSGPPSTDRIQSLITAKAGKAAMTAPKPTRLETLRMGSAEAFTPASMLSRMAVKRLRLQAITVQMATDKATITDHTPPTAAIDVLPQRSSSRNEASMRGNTTKDISRLTAITTSSGSSAIQAEGNEALRCPCWISAGSKSCAVLARPRTTGSSATSSVSTAGRSP